MRFSGIKHAGEQFSKVLEVHVLGSYACGLASESSDLDLVLRELEHEPGPRIDLAGLIHVRLADFDGRLSVRDPDVELERVPDGRFAQRTEAIVRKGPWSRGESYESIVEFWEWLSMRPLGIDRTSLTTSVPDLADSVANACLDYSRAALEEAADPSTSRSRVVRLQRGAVGAALSGWLADHGEPNPKPKWRRAQIERLRARNVDCRLAEQLLVASVGADGLSFSEQQKRNEILCRRVYARGSSGTDAPIPGAVR